MNTQQVEAYFGKSLRAMFQEANTSRSGEISPGEAKVYFPKFNVPQIMLKTLWSKYAPPPSNTMKYMGFEGAMTEICQFKTQGSTGAPPMGGVPIVPQNQQASGGIQMTPQERQKYEGFFRQLQKNGMVQLQDGINFFLKSGLSNDAILSIWNQFDTSGKRLLNMDEFCNMMQYVMIKKRGGNPPLPQNVQRPTMQPQSIQPIQPMNLIQPTQPLPQMSTSGPIQPLGQLNPAMNPQINHQRGGNIQQTEARISRLQEETKALGKHRFEVDGENTRLNLKIQELQGREESLQEAIQKQRLEIQNLESQRDNLQNQIHQLNQSIEQGKMERSQILNQLTNVRQETFRLESILNNLNMQKNQVFDERKQALNEIEVGTERLQKLKDEIKAFQDQNIKNENELSQSEMDTVTKLREIEEKQQQLYQLRIEADELSSKVFEFETKKRIYVEVNNKLAEQIKSLQSKKSELNKKLQQQKEASSEFNNNNANAQSIRLTHILKAVEHLLQNADDILNDRTVSINVMPVDAFPVISDVTLPERMSSTSESYSIGKSLSSTVQNNNHTNLNSDSQDNKSKKVLPPVPKVSIKSSKSKEFDALASGASRKDEPSKPVVSGFDDFLGDSSSGTSNSQSSQPKSDALFDDFFDGTPTIPPATQSSPSVPVENNTTINGFDDNWGNDW